MYRKSRRTYSYNQTNGTLNLYTPNTTSLFKRIRKTYHTCNM